MSRHQEVNDILIIVRIYQISTLNSVPNYIIATLSIKIIILIIIIMVPNLTQTCTYATAFYM